MSVFTLLTLMSMIPFSLSTFPVGRCYQKACLASPYSATVIADNDKQMCIAFENKNCYSDPQYDCCTRFTDNVIKIVLPSVPECNSSVSFVTINGEKKGGGIYFDVFDNDNAELRITNLYLNNTQMLSSIICINFKNVCLNMSTFCRQRNDPRCLVTFYDPTIHDCCPTCPINSDSTTLPLSPPRQNSPPPSPKLESPPFSPVRPKPPPSPKQESPSTPMHPWPPFNPVRPKPPPPSPSTLPPWIIMTPNPPLPNNQMVCNCTCTM